MSTREQFYDLRDRRTTEYGVTGDVFERTVRVVVGKRAADSVNGQFATLALVNMLARLHRSLDLDIPAVPLRRQAVIGAARLDEAAAALAQAIDPYISSESRQPLRV